MEEEQNENPFLLGWESFGFKGKPSAGYNYLWSEVQNYLTIIGHENYIQNCKLFSTPLNPNIYMIRTQDDIEEIWDVTNIEFTFISNDFSILVASCSDACIHISNVSTSFIELLMKGYKLPLDSLDKFISFQSTQFKTKLLSPQTNIPEDRSKIST